MSYRCKPKSLTLENKETDIFKRMVLPHAALMERLLARMLGEEDARDALQDTLLRLWEHREALSAADNIRAYCLTTARNVATNRLRSRHFEESIEEVPIVESGADADDSDDLRHAEALLEKLPEAQRRAIRLRSYCDMEVEEIAVRMEVSEANVRQLLSRGRRRLRELFKADTF